MPGTAITGVSRVARAGLESKLPPVPDRAVHTPTASPHVGSHSRYSAGCRCPSCRASHTAYLVAWRAGRIRRSADTAPVRAHLQQLVGSGPVLGYLADEAGVPRRSVYRIWHCTGRIAPATAAALLALRPLLTGAVLPAAVRDRDALDAAGVSVRLRRTAGTRELDLWRRSAGELAAELGVSVRTVQRWRAAQPGPPFGCGA